MNQSQIPDRILFWRPIFHILNFQMLSLELMKVWEWEVEEKWEQKQFMWFIIIFQALWSYYYDVSACSPSSCPQPCPVSLKNLFLLWHALRQLFLCENHWLCYMGAAKLVMITSMSLDREEASITEIENTVPWRRQMSFSHITLQEKIVNEKLWRSNPGPKLAGWHCFLYHEASIWGWRKCPVLAFCKNNQWEKTGEKRWPRQIIFKDKTWRLYICLLISHWKQLSYKKLTGMLSSREYS